MRTRAWRRYALLSTLVGAALALSPPWSRAQDPEPAPPGQPASQPAAPTPPPGGPAEPAPSGERERPPPDAGTPAIDYDLALPA